MNQPPAISSIFPLALVFVVFYFMLIRPQKKQQKEHKQMLEQVKKNDEVITAGGIHGTVVNVKDKTVMVRVDDSVKIEIEKSFITTIKKA
ncbi:preprotein translocase subunit YajC [Candidatus Omnitrophota bacterium]